MKKDSTLKTLEQFIKTKNKILKSEVATKVIKNSSWLVGDKAFTMLIGVFVIAIIARYFGPEKFGQFNYALSFTALFTALSTLGLETLTVKSIVDEDYDEGAILCTSLILRAIGGILLTIIAGIIIRIIEPNDTNLHILVLIMSFTMVLKSLEVIEYWIQAYQKAKISSIIRMSAYVLSAILKICLVIFRGGLIQYALIYSIDALIIGTSLIIAYYKFRENKDKWKININYAKYIMSQSWYLILSGLMITLYMKIDNVMLGSMMPSRTEVGIYSAATQVASMWYFVPMAVITSLKPVIMGKKKIDEKSYIKSLQLLYTIVAWMGIGFGIFILGFSNIIIGILYGAEYANAASILSISVWAGTFAMLGSARSIWLICEGLQKYTLIYTFVGLVVNISLNYILIPIMGGYGAAIATLSAQFSANILALVVFKDTRISTIMILKSFSPKRLLLILKNS
ncbi:flippase [Clostridia bacterium]|nr:flippase [Clostridia bacterium]